METSMTHNPHSHQVVAGPLVLEHTFDQHLFRIMLRETVAADGFVYRQRIISISPRSIAREALDPLAFADVLQLLVDKIRDEFALLDTPPLLPQKGSDSDSDH